MAGFERILQSLLRHGGPNDLIARINCSPLFNMRKILVTRDTLTRLAGYGAITQDRYLDDQVLFIIFKGVVNVYKILYCSIYYCFLRGSIPYSDC